MREPNLRYVTCTHPTGLHRMAYWEWSPANGASDAPVVVCVHGLTRNGRDFDVVADMLAELNYRVVAVDIVGRGRSDRMPDAALYMVPQYVADCTTLIARLDVDTVTWIGTSMGGLIGMAMAALPGNAIGKMLLNDVGPVLSVAGLMRIRDYVGKDPQFKTFDEGEALLRASMVSFGPHTDTQFRLLSQHFIINKGDHWGFHYDPAIAQPFNDDFVEKDLVLWPIYDAVSCPVTVIRGAESDLLSQEVAVEMTGRGPNADVVVVEGVGHAPTLIVPEQLAVVKAFVTGDTIGA